MMTRNALVAAARCVVLAGVGLLLALSLSESAPSWADEKEDALKLLAQGDKFFNRGERLLKRNRQEGAVAEFERALVRYQKAYELVPNPRILYIIAQAEAQLGRHIEAFTHYQQVLNEVTDLTDELRAEVETMADASKQHIAVLVLTVSGPSAESVAVQINDEPRDDATNGPLYMVPGEYKVAANAEDFIPQEFELALEAGTETERTIELKPIPMVVKDQEKPPDSTKKKVSKISAGPSKTQLYVGGTLTVGFATAATITGLSALSRQSTFDDETLPKAERDAAASSGKTLALVTDLLVAGAVIAGGYTVYHYLGVYKPKKESARPPTKSSSSAKVFIIPYVDREGGGLSAGGRF